MLKKVPIKLRLTILSMLLLTICCVMLTLILNFSANQMANTIEAIPVLPATKAGENGLPVKFASATIETVSAQTGNSQQARLQFLYQSIAYMVVVVLVGGGLTYYISGKALQPLYEFNRQMKNRTEHNLSERLPIPESHDEIADLTCSFNEMSCKLDEAFEAQKRFAQSAAHELRTPLTVLKTKIDVFGKKATHTAEEYDKLLSVITKYTNRLSELVKDLLELTNIDALDYSDRIEVKTMLTDISKELYSFTKDKNIAITIYGEEQTVYGNKILLHRAFYNLIENAIKYNVENGQVKVLVSNNAGHTVITIVDTGIGIPVYLQTHIFEPFFRVDKSRSRQMGGAGLGLTTVKSIIEKHGGEITVSDNMGGGTIFTTVL